MTTCPSFDCFTSSPNRTALFVVIPRGCDFFDFSRKATLKTLVLYAKKSRNRNLVTHSERSEESLFSCGSGGPLLTAESTAKKLRGRSANLRAVPENRTRPWTPLLAEPPQPSLTFQFAAGYFVTRHWQH